MPVEDDENEIDEVINAVYQKDYPLKPCPLCGRKVGIHHNKYFGYPDSYFITCKCGLGLDGEDDPKRVADKWNNRISTTCDIGCSICLIHNNMKCPKMKCDKPVKEDDSYTITTNVKDGEPTMIVNINSDEPLISLNPNEGDWK